MMRIRYLILILAVAWAAPALATTDEQEIQYLLHSIGTSACTFTRNGTTHTATEAEDHLAMKYRRAGSRVKTAEAFIKYLATKSSWTGKPYSIECDGASTPSGDWLTDKLNGYRSSDGHAEGEAIVTAADSQAN